MGHFGWDTYPMIATSRVLGWSDLAGNPTEEVAPQCSVQF